LAGIATRLTFNKYIKKLITMIKRSLLNWATIILIIVVITSCNDSLQEEFKRQVISTQGGTTNTSTPFATNVWQRVADFPLFKFGAAASFTIGETAYVGTGSTFTAGPSKDFWKYDLATNTWTQIADFGGGGRENAFGFSIGEKGYVGTGTGADVFNQKDFWEYDRLTNQWTRKADFGGGVRYGATSFAIDTKGYVGAGASLFGETNPVGTIPPPTIF
jgi:N-acetylneuraminic acid mutarotase